MKEIREQECTKVRKEFRLLQQQSEIEKRRDMQSAKRESRRANRRQLHNALDNNDNDNLMDIVYEVLAGIAHARDMAQVQLNNNQ